VSLRSAPDTDLAGPGFGPAARSTDESIPQHRWRLLVFVAVRVHYTEAMIELSIDHPVPELIAAEDASTLRAIDEGIAQLDGGHGIPLQELREELARRCSK